MSEIHWLNPISGNFTNASDWSGGVVPGANDDAILDAAGTTPYTVTVSTTATVTSFQTAANATLSIPPTAEFAVTGATGSVVNAGTIITADTTFGKVSDVEFEVQGVVNNSGLIQLGSSLGFGILDVTNKVTLTGGGQVAFDDSYGSGFIDATYDPGVDGPGTLINVDNTISGGGEIVSATDILSLVNETKGVIDANANELLISAATTNEGLMEATGIGSLLFYANTVNNAGGTILASGGQVYLNRYVDIIGGTLQTMGAGVIYSELAATLDGQTSAVHNEGLLRFIGTGGELSADLTLRGQIINSGVIEMDQAPGGDEPDQDTLIIDTANVTLSGGGAVMLQNNPSNEIVGAAPASILTNVDNTISGAGQVGAGQLTLVNEAAGVIDATGTNGPLILDTGSSVVTNDGLLEATGAGGLLIQDTTVNGSGGGVISANGSAVYLQGADIQGGTLRSSGTAVIHARPGANVFDGSASAVTNQGTVVIDDGQALTIQGAIHNAGEIGFVGTGDDTSLVIGAAGATLSGGGRLILDNEADNIISGVSSAATLTNVDNVLSGAGQLGAGSLTLINEAQGVIVGSHAAPLVIDTGANTIVNAGRIEAKGTGGVTIRSAVNNSGRLEAAGGVLTVNGAVSGTGAAVIYGGALDFTSSFTQKVAFRTASGVLELGQSQSYTGAVVGFSKTGGTSFDLADIGFVGAGEATFSGNTKSGVLTVTDGTHTAHITLIGDYTGSIFTASSDGRGGTTIVDPPAPSPANAHQFIAAMARIGGLAGEAIHTTEARSVHQLALANPRMTTA